MYTADFMFVSSIIYSLFFPHEAWLWCLILLCRSCFLFCRLSTTGVDHSQMWIIAFACVFLLCVCCLWALLSRAIVELGEASTPPAPLASLPHTFTPPHIHHLHIECSNTFQGCFVGEILRWNIWDSWMQGAVVTSVSSFLPTHSHSFCLLGASATKKKKVPRVSPSSHSHLSHCFSGSPHRFLTDAWDPLVDLDAQPT